MDRQTRSFSDLPRELVSDISERLGLIDLLSFRGLCKITRSASSNSSAAIESSSQCSPWFLLYGDGPNCSVVTNTKNKRRYNINLPEIADSTCVFSLAGWLLCLSPDSSIFLFCPFSKAKINLPNCPFSLNDSHFAASFSHSPTNRDCAVVVLRRNIENDNILELCFLRRGDNEWYRYKYFRRVSEFGAIMSVVHHEGVFHFLDGSDRVVTFDCKWKTWSHHDTEVSTKESTSEPEWLRYIIVKDRFSLESNEMKSVLGIEEAAASSIIICGTTSLRRSRVYHLIQHEKYNSDQTSETEDHNIEGLRQLKGVWIQPRFHQIPPNQSWS